MAPDTFPGMNRTLADYSGWRLPFHDLGKTLSYWAMLTKYKVHVTGREHIPGRDTRFMVASNHLSNWDPVLLGNLIPHKRVAFIAKRELVEINPIVNTIMDGLGIITIDRKNVSVASIRSAKTVAQHPKWILGIFPEGTRGIQGTAPAAETTESAGSKRGAAFLAKATGSHVLPVGITYQKDKKPHGLYAHIGELVAVPANADVDALSETIMTAIRAAQAIAQHAADQQ